MATEFRLLGDVQAVVDGRLVDLGHARQRCVLAVLLVESNRVVPADQLLDRVWADRPPQRARTTLSSYLSRLRQVLAGAADVGLARRPGGYVVTVDPMAVDLHRFRHLIAEARAAGGDGAARLYEQALGLWHGEAFATLETPWLGTMRDAVAAELLAAELERNDLALARGGHAALLGDLATRAAAYPLDERLAGQLILAMYRSGRQADALARYEQLRRRLAEELGVDPSPALQQLYRQILTADPTLAATTPPTTPAAAVAAPATTLLVVPRQLPAPPHMFTGRTPEIAALDAVLDGVDDRPAAVVISAVSGTAGVGKTALAVHWAHRVADRFPDGQLYVNLRGFDPSGSAVEPAEAVRGFLDALGVPPQRSPAGLDAQAALYRSLLAGRRVLVVIDNARDAEQVRPLLPGSPGCLVVVTSRAELSGLVASDGARPLTLDLLTEAEARALLARLLGDERTAAEPYAIDEIIARCARLPLALAIVAARAATHPRFRLETLAAELRDSRGALDALATGDAVTDVRAVLSWSYRTLSIDAARLFRLLGLHPGPDVAAPAAASLAGVASREARALLAELARAHLVAEHAPGRFTFHDLLRAYAAELACTHDSDGDRTAAAHRLFDHYLHTAHTAALVLDPYRDEVALAPAQAGVVPERIADLAQAMAWFAAEHPVLLAAIERATQGFDTHTWQLAWTLMDFLDRRGHWRDWVATHDTALAAARRLADRRAQTYLHRGIANAYRRLGRDDDARAHLGRALDLFRELGDHAGQAHTHLGLSIMDERAGSYPDALDHAQRSLALYRTAGDRTGQARALNAVGWYHTLLGDHQQALSCCQQALTMNQELGDRLGQAGTWDSIGYAHHLLGDHQRAITCYRHALRLFESLGDLHYEAVTLDRLGDAYLAASDLDAARRVWEQALDLLAALGDPEAGQVRAKLQAQSGDGYTRAVPQ
jgi:DNA-binding SARP family transcriptional activator